MLVDMYMDIERLKKEYGKYDYNEIDDDMEIVSNGLDNYTKLEYSLNSFYELMESMEGINDEVMNNKKLLKSLLDKDHEVKEKCVEKVKCIINAYVNFYDYVDDIKQSIEESNIANGNLIDIVNSMLGFLEKEYLNIGLIVHIPNVYVDEFDTYKHEIVATEKRSKFKDNVIVAVKKKGFYYNDRTIRYFRNAKVITVLN
jgi:molecular chaperone GrpE (heat shock protein)